MSEDRFGGPRPRPSGPPADRGNFNGPSGDRGGFNGPSGDRGGFNGPSGDRGGFDRPRFPRPAPPAPGVGLSGPLHSVKLKQGDLEIEVSGSAAFVRQTIDDLPILLAKMRGEKAPRPVGISMPVVADEPVPAVFAGIELEAPRQSTGAGNGKAGAKSVGDGLEADILAVMRAERRPLAVAAIRKRIGDDVTAQQVRRTLERSRKVIASDDRPTEYSLR